MELSGLRIGALEHMLPESERHRLMEYVKLFQMRQKADDHTACPMCNEQLYFCECIAWEASELLEMLIGIHEVNNFRMLKCNHEWDYAEGRLEASFKTGVRVSATCKKCGWHRSYWKYM